MRKTITILGSTGTIGCNTLKVIKYAPHDFEITALVGGENVELLAKQAIEFRPKIAVISNPNHYAKLKELLSGTGIECASGDEAVLAASAIPADITMSAIVGVAGLKPTLTAIKHSKTIAMANKECLVCAGDLMQQEVTKYGAKLIPVDSEHNAIFQLAPLANDWKNIEQVTITASGGPFRTFSLEQMQSVTPAQAVAHPNWNMGVKISVDSATLMNKGLELIEAFYLFPLKYTQLNAIIHPQSIIHALVSMIDGSVLSQLSQPDMCVPIANALAYPSRMNTKVKKLNLEEIGKLTFESIDEARFPAIKLAKEAMKTGGNAPTILNAANEIAVEKFLRGEIAFLDIARIVEKTLNKLTNQTLHTIEEVLECDRLAREISVS